MFRHDDILLRVVEPDDLERLRAHRNDPSTWAMLTDVHLLTAEDQCRWYEGLRDRRRRYFVAQELPADRAVPFLDADALGADAAVGLVRMDEIDQTNRSIRVGCDVFPGYRGRGLGTRIFAATLAYAFDVLNMHRVWLAVIATNAVARRIYDRQGLMEEGCYREAIFRDGRYVDYVVMSILEHEYRRTR